MADGVRVDPVGTVAQDSEHSVSVTVRIHRPQSSQSTQRGGPFCVCRHHGPTSRPLANRPAWPAGCGDTRRGRARNAVSHGGGPGSERPPPPDAELWRNHCCHDVPGLRGTQIECVCACVAPVVCVLLTPGIVHRCWNHAWASRQN